MFWGIWEWTCSVLAGLAVGIAEEVRAAAAQRNEACLAERVRWGVMEPASDFWVMFLGMWEQTCSVLVGPAVRLLLHCRKVVVRSMFGTELHFLHFHFFYLSYFWESSVTEKYMYVLYYSASFFLHIRPHHHPMSRSVSEEF